MSRQVYELETVLQGLIDEHASLLSLMENQQAAMKTLDLRAMDDVTRAQESVRGRIAALENRRRMLVQLIGRSHRMQQAPGIRDIASLYPPAAPKLLKLREQLKQLMHDVQARTHVASRLATAVLGHLNTVVRLIAGAVEKAGLYTKNGVPQVSARIGVMEAVG